MSKSALRGQSHTLLERDDAVGRLDELAGAAADRRGAISVITGRPGEGKTALLDVAAVLGERAGLTVHRAYGSALERPFAFGIARQLLTGPAAELDPSELLTGAARMAAGVLDLDRRTQPLDPLGAQHGLYWVLVHLARRQPMALLVDDAHWADQPSLRWLASLRRRIGELSVLVVIATRLQSFDGTGDPLTALLTDLELPLLRVSPLSADAVGALAARELSQPADHRLALACHGATGGNPLAVAELLRDLRSDRSGGPIALEGLGDRAPETVARHVRGRLEQLGPEAVGLGQALAVLGERVPLRQVAALAGIELERANQLVDDLTLAGVVARSPELRFEHPLIHAAVQETIADGRRATLHARAAALLASDQSDPEVVAAHLIGAEPAEDPVAVSSLRLAAMAALRRGSPEGALAYLERALAEPPPIAQRAEVLGEIGVAAWMSAGSKALGRIDAALALFAEPRERARLRLILAELCYFGGQRERLFDALDRGLAELGDADPELALKIRAMRTTALAGLDSGWPAAEDADHQALAREAGAGKRLGRELCLNLALVGIWNGRVSGPATVAAIEAAIDQSLLECSEAGSISRVAHGLFALVFAGAPDRAAELSERMMTAAMSQGMTGKLGVAAHVHALAQLGRGALPSAETSGRLSFELTMRTESAFAEPLVRATLGAVLTERGALEEAHQMLTAVSPDVRTLSSCYFLRPALVALYRARGERNAALEQLAALREEFRAGGWPNPAWLPWRSEMAALIAAEDPDRALALAEDELAHSRRLELPRAIAQALRARSLAEPEEARVPTLRESVAMLERDPARLELVRSLIALGSELRRTGQRRAAREPLRRALDLAHRCAAPPLIALVTEELHAADGRPRRPWLIGAESLTPSEQRVARLAASGASNQRIAEMLFISIKTVEMHLTNAYRKLGASSRSDLPRLLDRQGAAPGE